jgi:hypothetical protein
MLQLPFRDCQHHWNISISVVTRIISMINSQMENYASYTHYMCSTRRLHKKKFICLFKLFELFKLSPKIFYESIVSFASFFLASKQLNILLSFPSGFQNIQFLSKDRIILPTISEYFTFLFTWFFSFFGIQI